MEAKSPPLRVLMINYEFPPVGGGGGVAAANLAAALVNSGHEVDYVTTLIPGLAPTETWRGVKIFREPVPWRNDKHTASIISMLAFPPVAIRRCLKLARARRYSIVHTHFAIPSGPAGYIVSKRLKLKHVVSIYGGDIYDPSKRYSPHKHPILNKVVKAVLNQSDAVVGESLDICDKASQYYTPRQSVSRIPLGFCPPVFTPRSRRELEMEEGAVYAIAVSRLISRKDYPTLLKAFAQSTARNLRLLIVGDGPSLQPMQLLVSELGIDKRVLFKGAVDDAMKFALLNASDFFLLSPLHEGYGIVFQEAMYCGLPIVTTNNGGHTDFLRHEQNALLAAPGDVSTLAIHISRMADDVDLRKTIGAKNSLDIQEQLIESVSNQYEQLYQQLINRGA